MPTARPILYLHGFASSPGSHKAVAFAQRWQQRGHLVSVPDLNGPQGFAHLRLTDIVSVAKQCAQTLAQQTGLAPLVVGSSLGGYTALRLAIDPQVQLHKVVAMAPAIGFIDRLIHRLGPSNMAQWRTNGTFAFEHFGLKQSVPVWIDLIDDGLQQPPVTASAPRVTVLLIHGQHDDSVPVAVSIDYARQYPQQTTLEVIDSDHGLLDKIEWMDQRIVQFFAEI